MTLRSIYLSIAMLSATALWGFSVYSADAIAGNVPADGYGISAIMVPVSE